jgi:molybdopterin/thiamine biosynthesis adenylyltransferase
VGHKRLVTADPSQTYPGFLQNAQFTNLRTNMLEAPRLFCMEQAEAVNEFEKFVKKSTSVEVVDNYAEQYAELLLSKNAHLYRANHAVQVASIKKLLDEHYDRVEPWKLGTWVFYPWSNQLVHVLAQDDFEALRTIRNRDLITIKEQSALASFDAICFGMSVGSAGALALAISGISRRIKLVDGAVISGSNLNRILTGVSSVGKAKSTVVGQLIYEMNPYSTVDATDKVTAKNISKLFNKPWRSKVAIDEIDDIEMKVSIRIEARKRGIPVVMATELGDTVMIDVERFDLEPDRPLFHGLVPGIEKTIDTPPENHREWMKYAVKIIDPHNMPIKMQESLLKIGTTIVTHPQLGSTVMMTGGALAFTVKNIALGSSIKSGRYVISLENTLLADHVTRAHKRKHKKHTEIIESAINSM